MNRLILIGNGFDLAHGLKTSYKDFIIWYLAHCFQKAGFNNIYEDELIKIKSGDVFVIQRLLGYVRSNKASEDSEYYHNFISHHYESRSLETFFDSYPEIEESYEEDTDIPPYQITRKSSFLKSLISSCSEYQWVDIENHYFEELLKLQGLHEESSFNLEDVKNLNKDFDYLKTKLIEYLSIVDTKKIELNPDIIEILNSKFILEEISTLLEKKSIVELNAEKNLGKKNQHFAYILNFNYTNSFSNYLEKMRYDYFSKTWMNQIHGQLNDTHNPIIFGFGDEHNKEYLKFEELKINALFDHIKSYQYLRTSNYRELIRFLNQGNFQVFIMGHSCGLSDRTMFKEIFEHNNCKSIKIFHYKRPDEKTDFHEKTLNIGRHFSNKGLMRKLIVEFNKNDFLPQTDLNN